MLSARRKRPRRLRGSAVDRMFNPDTDFIFPSRVIPKLGDLRGEEWRQLVEKAANADPMDGDHLAFVLMMVRINGCESCNTDSFRAMRGCTSCSVQTIERSSEGEKDFLRRYQKALKDVEKHQTKTKKVE